MRFQVPQFIEVEDKIFGPFTLKQFIYMAGGAGVTVALFSILPKLAAILISAPIIALSIALTFFKVNNRSFILILESFFKYWVGKRLYIWKKKENEVIKGPGGVAGNPQVYIPHLSDSKLKDLSWSLDVKQANTENVKHEV
jgi:hypothetical protein